MEKAQKRVADAAAHQKGLVAGLVQPVQDFKCALRYFVPGNVVGRAGNDLRFDSVSPLFSMGFQVEEENMPV